MNPIGELPGGAFLTATSPGFPSNYANNLEETWTVTAAEGQVFLIDFNVHEMEYGFDFLRIGGGGFCETEYYREFTGFDLPRPFLITNDSLCCHFSTDRSNNFRGWSMGVYVLDPDGEFLKRNWICSHNVQVVSCLLPVQFRNIDEVVLQTYEFSPFRRP